MKLREFDFNSIDMANTLAVRMEEGQWYQGQSIGETLKALPAEFADAEIKETRWYFGTYVIELKQTM